MSQQRVILEDGDALSVVVRLSPSLSDMANSIAAIARRYRIVADVRGPTLSLVPLDDVPSKLSFEAFEELRRMD